MPAKTEKQRRFMGAELSRARAGKKTQTGMSEDKLSEFASKSMDAIDAYLHKVDIPDVKIKPGERIGGPGDRIQLVPKNPKKKGSEIKKDEIYNPGDPAKPKRRWKADFNQQMCPSCGNDLPPGFGVKGCPYCGEKEKLLKKSAFAKSMNLIDAYLFKHGHILPCGHHAEDGDDIDKACTSGGCGAMGGSTSYQAQRSTGGSVNTGASEASYWSGRPEG